MNIIGDNGLHEKMKRLDGIEGAIKLRFQYHKKKIFEKSLKVFNKEFKKEFKNLSFDELMQKPVSDEENEEFYVPTVEEMLEFYIGEIIYEDMICPEIYHMSNNYLFKILNEKGYENLLAWENEISAKYIEEIFKKIKEVNN